MPEPTKDAPDAILYPANIKQGRSQIDRATFVQKLFGPVLGGKEHTQLGPEHGGRVYSREVGGGWMLATLNHDDSMEFPTTHEYARLPRYRWEDQGDGTRFGYLLTAEEMEQQAEGETPAERQAREMSAEAIRKAQAELNARRERIRAGAVVTPPADRRERIRAGVEPADVAADEGTHGA